METYLAETKQRVPAIIFDHTKVNILRSPSRSDGYPYTVSIKKIKDTVEITEFSRPLVKNLNPRKTAIRSHHTTDKPYRRRLDNIYRARNKARLDLLGHFPRTPQQGCSPAFITLTLDADHEHLKSDIKWFTKEVYKFIRRMRARRIDVQLKFALEWQDGKRLTYWDKRAGKKPRMALHAHMLCTNFPYLPGDFNAQLRKLWPNGNAFVDRIGTSNEDRVRVAHYLTKYLTKDSVTANIKYAKMVWTTQNYEQQYAFREGKTTLYIATKMTGRYYIVYQGKWNPMYKLTAQDEVNRLSGWTPILARKTILLPITPT